MADINSSCVSLGLIALYCTLNQSLAGLGALVDVVEIKNLRVPGIKN